MSEKRVVDSAYSDHVLSRAICRLDVGHLRRHNKETRLTKATVTALEREQKMIASPQDKVFCAN